MEPPRTRLGTRIDRYEVLRELGRGGMGVVLEVRDPDLDRTLALKLLDGPAAGPEERLRFKREAELMARVRHRSVVAVHEVGEGPSGPFIACERVDGRGLDVLLKGGPLAPREAARLVRELADGLAACHTQGVLHRDLKPANVIVRPDGTPVLIDFGIARDERAASLTETGTLLGTPNYMAPEQAEGRPVDAQADVWGAGAVLFACLAGRPPFDGGGNVLQVLQRVLTETPTWPAGAPRELEAILRRAMARDPEKRHADAAELRDDLDRWLREGSTARPRLALLAVGLVVALVLLVVGLLAAPSGRAPPVDVTPGSQPPVDAPPGTSDVSDPAPPAGSRPAWTTSEPARRFALPNLEQDEQKEGNVRGAFLDDGSILAGLDDGSIRAWAGLNAEPVLVRRPTSAPAVTTIAPVGSGRACCGTADGALLLVDVAARSCTPVALPGRPGRVWALAHRGGLLALSVGSAKHDHREGWGELRLALLGQDGAVAPVGSLALAAPAQAIAFSGDGRWLAVAAGVKASGEKGAVVVLSLARPEEPPRTIDTSAGAGSVRRGVAWIGPDRLAVGGTPADVVLCDVRGVDAPLFLRDPSLLFGQAHDNGVLGVAARGRWLVTSSLAGHHLRPSGDVKVWDLEAGGPPRKLERTEGVRFISISPRGDLFLLSGPRRLEAWAFPPEEPRSSTPSGR